MSRRTRQRVETGFASLRDLGICCLGAYGFWWQVTRVADPSVLVLAFCGVLMAAPGALAAWRVLAPLPPPDESALREIIREEMRKVREP